MKRLLAIVIFIVCSTVVFAQSNLTTYQLYKTLPQSNYLNPAFIPDHKVVIGLPGISSLNFGFVNGRIAMNEAFVYNSDDSLIVNSEQLPSVVRDKNHIKLVSDVQLFNLGIRGKKSYFSFNIISKNYSRLTYPGELIGWAVKGPAHPDYANKAFQISNFKFSGASYIETGISYGRDASNLLPGLALGFRFKVLKGIAGGKVNNFKGELFVGQDSVHLKTQEITVNTAGVDFFDDDPSSSDMISYMLNSKNTGFAIDFGATYKLTEKLMISAAVNDLGFINWKDYTSRYTISAVDYKFTGFDILAYLNNKSSGSIDAEIDSLENLFSDEEVKGESFKTWLVTKAYIGAHFDLNKTNSFGATMYLDFFKGQVSPAFGLNYNLKLGRIVNVVLGAALSNGSVTNIMGGLVLKLGVNQFYLATDRVNSFYYPARASHANLHAGMNLVFGRPEKKIKIKDEKPKDQPKEVEPLPEKEIVTDSVKVEEEILKVPDSTLYEAPIMVEDTITVEADTIQFIEEPVVIAIDTVMIEPDTVIAPLVVEKPRETIIVVRKGTNLFELPPGHYVIVGVFNSHDNVLNYSKQLQEAGYENKFGFVSEKGAYYLYAFYEATDVEKIIKKRDELRKINKFQFPQAWWLNIQ